MRLKTFFKEPCFLIILSALLSALPLTFEYLFAISWMSFIPLFYVIIKHSGDKLRYVFTRGFLFGFIYHLCIYYWFLWFYPLDFAGLSGSESAAVVLLASVGISAVHGALWCIPTVLCYIIRKISNNPFLLSFSAIVGIISAEKLTSISELSFPWARLSLGQYKATVLIQSASLFGIDGVDMLILAVNALLAICVVSTSKKRTIAAVVAVGIFLVNLGFGIIRINTAQNGEALTIMTVQGSIEQKDKWSNNGDTICYDVYSSLTKENITEDVDLILWPESAVPKIYKNEKTLKQYAKLSAELDTPILAGILLKNDGNYTNNSVFITKDGVIATYAKRQLVPFGEYMPYQAALSKAFPALSNLNIIEDNYVSGNSTTIMNTQRGRFGNIICFESIYPELSRQSVLDGAELLIEVTNDSWLKDSPAMKQHLAHGVFRSIENGRYLVRSANSGISAVIDSCGKVLNQIDINRQGVLIDTIYFSNSETIYTKTGGILFPISVAALLVWFLISVIQKFKKSNGYMCYY